MIVLDSLTYVSALLFLGINIYSINNFGLLSCYSAYGEKWGNKFQTVANVWGLLTILCALLMIPEMIELGEGNSWQFLGFFAPLYLVMVGATPNYTQNSRIWAIHSCGAILSAVTSLLWMFLVIHCYILVFLVIMLFIILMVATRTKNSWLYWCEMSMYFTIYTILIFLY